MTGNRVDRTHRRKRPNIPPRSAINYHHVFWESKDYSTTFTELELTRHSRLVVPAFVSHHKVLHRFLSPPEKPDQETMDSILDTVGQDQNPPMGSIRKPRRPHLDEIPTTRIHGLYLVVGMLLNESEYEPSPHRAIRLRHLSDHICQQMVLMENGYNESGINHRAKRKRKNRV